MKIKDDLGQAVYEDTERKMTGVVDHYRRAVADLEMRASGRVTPALLDGVGVSLEEGATVKLQEIATVGIRDGTNLLVTVFEEDSLKSVERALYAAKIANVVPQKVDNMTLKLPMPKPTIESQRALVATAAASAEETRVILRNLRGTGIKRAKLPKHDSGIDEFQKLMDKYVVEVDKLFEKMKKNYGK